jgi:hypothetical protein
MVAVLPENDPGLGERIVSFRFGISILVLRSQSERRKEAIVKTNMARKPETCRSRTSSSYRSVSSGCTGGARRATIALSRPEPDEAGSSGMGCISFTVRVAPIGSADDGAIDSELTDASAKPSRGEEVTSRKAHFRLCARRKARRTG